LQIITSHSGNGFYFRKFLNPKGHLSSCTTDTGSVL